MTGKRDNNNDRNISEEYLHVINKIAVSLTISFIKKEKLTPKVEMEIYHFLLEDLKGFICEFNRKPMKER